MFFKKSAPHPDEVCPQCQGSKSRSMRVCTTCALQASRSADAPGPIPAQSAAMRPAYVTPAADAARPGAPAGGYRAEQGVMVRTQAERDIADFLWRNRILFGYEAPVHGRYPPFYLPEPGIVMDRRDAGFETRKAELTQAGLHVVPLPTDGASIDRDLRAHLTRFYPGREWR